MTQVTVQEAKMNLEALLELVLKGEEVIIEWQGETPIQLVRAEKVTEKGRRIGGVPDLVVYMADDFNEPLDDFAEYME